ncbi:MAG: ParA family protein, partial [Chloroflexi bacterium]|nr:ParA family protein [Chloroflexota bacterium]
MIFRPPYVVVVTAPSSGVGKSTLAGNLVVYLKALNEELPVAYASFDAQANVGEMFALSSGIAAPLSDLQ